MSDLAAPPLRTAAVARAVAGRRAGAEAEVARILEGAYRLIRRDGTVELNLRDLLAEVGLANRGFYRHFPTKDDFLLVMLEDLQGRLTAFLESRTAARADPVDQVRAWVLGVLEQAVNPETATLGRPFLVHAHRLQQAYPGVYRDSGGALLDLLEQAIRGSLDAGALRSANPRADARAIFHLVMSVMRSHVLDRTSPTPGEQSALLDFVLRALR